MKYEKVINRIAHGLLSRSDLRDLRVNALAKFHAGDDEAREVIAAIDAGVPSDQYILFMGFCPDADFNNRLDIEWKQRGVCEFTYYESTVQLERFNRVCAGDLVVLKKREKFGESMILHGHGRVARVEVDAQDHHTLIMNWSDQNSVIEVPLMGCNSTVDIKSIEAVEAEMPPEFFKWLEKASGT